MLVGVYFLFQKKKDNFYCSLFVINSIISTTKNQMLIDRS